MLKTTAHRGTRRAIAGSRAGRALVAGLVSATLSLLLAACGTPSPGAAQSTTSTTSAPAPATATTATTTTTTPTTPTTPTTTPATTTPTSPTTTTAPRSACVAPPSTWSATRVANQLLMVIGEFTSAQALATEAAAGVGGFVFLGEPAASAEPTLHAALAALDSDATGAGQVTPWMSTDTEGGPVSRLAEVLGAIPSARQMAAEWTPAEVTSEMAARGETLRRLGITMDLAPVLDTAAPTDPVAYESQRSFSQTPQVASTYGAAFAAGMRDAGVVAVGKHFPGLGHASADTDTEPATDPPLSQLRKVDLLPFAHVIASGLPVVMVGHPIVPGLTGGLPASLSPATYALLRTTLHFGGVAMTDALGAGAVSDAGYSEADAAVTALRAGADLPMVDASTWAAAVEAIEAAISDGTLPRPQADGSVARILAAKGVAVCPT